MVTRRRVQARANCNGCGKNIQKRWDTYCRRSLLWTCNHSNNWGSENLKHLQKM